MKCIYTWHRFYVEFGLIDLGPSLQYRDLFVYVLVTCLMICWMKCFLLDPERTTTKKDQIFSWESYMNSMLITFV